jgi:hypothetical protein
MNRRAQPLNVIKAPALGDSSLKIYTVDVKAMELIERRELASHALDEVSQSGGLRVAVGRGASAGHLQHI